MADTLEKTIAPFPGTLQAIREAFEAASHVLGASGLPQLLQNLSVEIPEAVTAYCGEIGARAEQTLQGTAPATLSASPVLTVVEEAAPPTIQVFALESLSWLDERGQRQNGGAFQIVALPVKTAKIALQRNLALLLDSDRYKAMRAEAKRTGWPHLADPMKTYDLSRDPNTTQIFNSATGRKIREERATFTNLRANELAKKVFVNRPEESF